MRLPGGRDHLVWPSLLQRKPVKAFPPSLDQTWAKYGRNQAGLKNVLKLCSVHGVSGVGVTWSLSGVLRHVTVVPVDRFSDCISVLGSYLKDPC